MYISYGTYTFSAGQVELAISKRVKRNARGFRESVTHTWSLKGMVEGTTQAGITSAIAALETAFGADGRDITLFQDDAAVSQRLLSRDCMGGTQVQSLSWPNGRGAEGVTFRTFEIVVEGEVIVTDNSEGSKIWDWQQKLSISGGGPRVVFAQPIRGKPVKYITAERTTFKATQSGSATGRFEYPPFPPALFPRDIVGDPVRERTFPTEQGTDKSSFAIAWSYQFESADPLAGKPGGP